MKEDTYSRVINLTFSIFTNYKHPGNQVRRGSPIRAQHKFSNCANTNQTFRRFSDLKTCDLNFFFEKFTFQSYR